MKSSKYFPNIFDQKPSVIILALSLSVLTISCQDILKENPKSVVEENFYNTSEEVATAVNAIYIPLREDRAEQIAILDTHSDWGYGRGSRAQYNDFAGFNAGNIAATTVRWNSFYLAIRNANLVILNTPEGEDISEEDILKYVAEAKFLRALSYFDLVRSWGGVPLRTDTNLQEMDVPKSSVEEVYSLIVADLEEAVLNLPESQSLVGRPANNAAKTMLADVYLTLGQYGEAAKLSAEVIESARYSLVQVASKEDFQNKLFGANLVTSTEEIFSFKYSRQVAQGNWILWILNHPATKLFNFGGAYAHYSLSSDPFYQTWDERDIRKSLWYPVTFGLGPNTLVSGKYIDNAAISDRGAGNDLPIYRFAEVLLIYAEAQTRSTGSPTPEAIEALNMVHRRAFGLDPNAPSEIDFLIEDYNLETFIDLVLTERAYEFQYEGKRWLDLKRTGKAQEVISAARGLTVSESHYLWPIPFEELNLNKAMNPSTDQNPGY